MKICGALLEVGGDRDERQLALGREEIADHVAAHEEIELAEQTASGRRSPAGRRE